MRNLKIFSQREENAQAAVCSGNRNTLGQSATGGKTYTLLLLFQILLSL